MSDIFTLESSSMSQATDAEPFVSKQWVSIPDVNNGNYGSNIVSFDTSSLYNSSKFINPSEMYIAVPLVCVISSNVNFGTYGISPYSLGFKNGYHNLVSACQIQYDNNTVQQVQLNSNYYVSFKMASSL